MRAAALVVLVLAAYWWLREPAAPERSERREPPAAPGPEPARSPAATAIEGHVRTAGGRAVPGARVRAGNVSAVADGAGAYRLAGVASQRLQVRASAPGFQAAERGPVHADPGERVTGIDFVLDAAFYVTGRALDAEGAPFPNAFVEVFRDRSRLTYFDAKEDGTFRSGPIGLPDPPRVRVSLYEITTGFPELSEVTAEPGGTIDVGDVRALRPARVTGTVLLPPGVPPSDVRVSGGVNMFSMVAADGGFDVANLKPGPVELEVYGVERRFRVTHRLTLKEQEHRTGVAIRVEPLLSIRGRVVESSGAPRAQATVVAFPPVEWVAFLTPKDCFFAETDAEGRFEITDLQPGRFRVGLDQADDRNVEIATWPRPVEVAAGATGVELRIPRAGVVAGRVGVPGSPMVQLLYEGGAWPEMWRGTYRFVEESGNFEFPVREPGSYQLRLSVEGFADAYTRPFAIGGDNRVELGEVPMHRAGSITGVAPGAAHVWAVAERTGGAYAAAEPDQKGRFRLAGLPPGVFTLVAVGRGLGMRAGVERGAHAEFALQPGAGHTLRLVDGAGRPVVDASVRGFRRGVRLAYVRSYTGRDGRLDFSFLPAGPVRLRIRTDGPELVRDLAWPAGPAREIEIRLP